MYPSFEFREDDLFFDDKDRDIIFSCRYRDGLRSYLQEGTRNFIYICNFGMPDVDFTDRKTVIDFLYSKWSKVPSESVIASLDSMTDYDFWKYFKVWMF